MIARMMDMNEKERIFFLAIVKLRRFLNPLQINRKKDISKIV